MKCSSARVYRSYAALWSPLLSAAMACVTMPIALLMIWLSMAINARARRRTGVRALGYALQRGGY